MSEREQPATYENGQDIRDRLTFACRVVKFCREVYADGGVGRTMVLQLVSCSTAPAAMLEEARAAESRRDFVSKCSIALKELRESLVRLRVMAACGLGSRTEASELIREVDELVAIVGAIVRNTKRNAAAGEARRSARIPNS